MLKNKSLLRFKEPQYGFASVSKQLGWRDLAKSLAVFAGKYAAGGFVIALIFYVFTGYRHGFAFNEGTVILFAVFILIGLVFGFVGWMTGYRNVSNPPEIIFFPERIKVRYFLGDEVETTYQEIQSYRISQAEIDQTKFRILEIKNWKGNEFAIEIEQNVRSEDIADIFKSKNVQMSANDQ